MQSEAQTVGEEPDPCVFKRHFETPRTSQRALSVCVVVEGGCGIPLKASILDGLRGNHILISA